MSLSSPFIHRPVGTTLLTIAIALAGGAAYFFLPVSPLPQVDFPSVSVGATLPGAGPETMASSVATPLERQFSRIAGITEMTSTSTVGSTNITILFNLDRNIDAAARDVQAAINAARGNLPANLPNNPTYRKINPADAPIMILALSSDVFDRGRLYDVGSSILAQKLSQISGVGQVFVGGGALPAVRVDVNPASLNAMGLGLEDVRNTLANANANRPKGALENGTRTLSLATTDQLLDAKDYEPLIIAFRNGSPVRIGDVAQVTNGIEDIRTEGLSGNTPSVVMVIFRQPGANIISTVDAIRAALPELKLQIPAAMHLSVAMDRTTTIRASVRDVQLTLLTSLALVVLVVFLFLRSFRATLIPSVAVPISLIGTFGVMYLLGYSIDNLSLMAMTIATGFVVDDAIVVIENITRHLEEGLSPIQAALLGAKEIGFTVLSISISLIAVFIPILLMGGYIGRLFREFAVTLSIAIVLSMLVSLTTTPMMCAVLLRRVEKSEHGRLFLWSEAFFDKIISLYERSLAFVMRFQFISLMITMITIVFTVYLYWVIPKGFFPQQDTGRLMGNIQADQATGAQAMSRLLQRFVSTVSHDPAVDNVIGFTGGGRGSVNSANMYVALKDRKYRKEGVEVVMARLRVALHNIPGATLYLQPTQDVRTTGHSTPSQYQYTLHGDSISDLNIWAPKLLAKLRTLPGVVDVNSDQQDKGLSANLIIDRDTAARLHISQQQIDDVLYDAFGQRQVSTMYRTLNQYHVVMEVDPEFWQNPESLRHIYVQAAGGVQVPLSVFSHYASSNTALAVNHVGQSPAITLSFNLLPGVSLSKAVTEIEQVEHDMGMPLTIQGSFAGTAQAYKDAQSSLVLLIIAAIVAVYIVLGILYESLIHPITILSTLPSAGVGALLALLVTRTDLTVIAVIGIILLIGIVKKNAIMMIDFALEAERSQNLAPEQAIFRAAVLRFRPITMTTMAALLGGLPLALGTGTGAELRQPLGIAIVGGLIFSQALTLYTTPVVYLYLDRFRLRMNRLWQGTEPPHADPLPA